MFFFPFISLIYLRDTYYSVIFIVISDKINVFLLW